MFFNKHCLLKSWFVIQGGDHYLLSDTITEVKTRRTLLVLG